MGPEHIHVGPEENQRQFGTDTEKQAEAEVRVMHPQAKDTWGHQKPGEAERTLLQRSQWGHSPATP